jgi:hypothetical protein
METRTAQPYANLTEHTRQLSVRLSIQVSGHVWLTDKEQHPVLPEGNCAHI